MITSIFVKQLENLHNAVILISKTPRTPSNEYVPPTHTGLSWEIFTTRGGVLNVRMKGLLHCCRKPFYAPNAGFPGGFGI